MEHTHTHTHTHTIIHTYLSDALLGVLLANLDTLVVLDTAGKKAAQLEIPFIATLKVPRLAFRALRVTDSVVATETTLSACGTAVGCEQR